jgi:hypothetical protein
VSDVQNSGKILLPTPTRVSHLIELASQSIYLVILAHVLSYPPIITDNTERRGFILIFLAATSLRRSWSSIPFVLTLASLVSCFPSTPIPGHVEDDFAYGILTIAFILHILQFLLPSGPTPIFLLSFEFWLPICALLSNCISQVFIPTLFFFIPLLSMILKILYLSLRDLFLLAMETMLLIMLVTLILVMKPSPSPKSSPWDRYSEKLGLDSRKIFVRAVVRYAGPYYFPPPFRLFQFILWPPSAALRARGASSAYLDTLERILWRITVGLIAAVVAGLWVWGLRQ